MHTYILQILARAFRASRRPFALGSSITTLLTLGCAHYARDEALGANASKTPTSAGVTAWLLERSLTAEDRTSWRELARWNDDCEEAFDASDAGAGSGLELFPLEDGLMLLAVLCAAGSYQPSFQYYRLDTHAVDASVAPIEFPTYESPDGRSLIHAKHTELWGEPSFLPGRAELVVLNYARQTRDCGTWARYSLAGGSARLEEFRVKLPCPKTIRSPVAPRAGSAPAGWKEVADH